MPRETEFTRQVRVRGKRRRKTLLILAAVCGFLWFIHHTETRNIRKFKAAASVAAMLPASFDEPEPSASEAPLVEYPVIVGGVHSLDDLKEALARYPNLYAGFDLKTADLIVLDHDVIARSSYRIGDKILWTRKAIVIRAGTSVWMDALGNVIEARCGNLLWTIREVVPPEVTQDPVPTTLFPPTQTPVATFEPTPATLDAGLIPLSPVLPPETFATPPTSSYGPVPPCCGGFLVPTVDTPPVSTPEPSTLLLTLFGTVTVFLIRRLT